MSNETFRGLLWSSPAGVVAQAMELAARSDHRHHVEGGPARSGAKFAGVWSNLPMLAAATGLLFLGFVLGTTLVVAFISL